MSAQERAKNAQVPPKRRSGAPKSRPRPEKIDVEKLHVFSIGFGGVRTLFWQCFWQVFGTFSGRVAHQPTYVAEIFVMQQHHSFARF